MCGRFSITKQESEIETRFNAKFYTNDYVKRYNIAPTQLVPAISIEATDQIYMFRWGLIPFWAKDPKIGNKMINARAEGVLESKVYAKLMKKSRCIIPSDGFYEWKAMENYKQPIRIKRKDDELFGMAALYDTWVDKDKGQTVNSFSIITTQANDLISEVHNRMPVILNKSDELKWLSNATATDELMSLLTPFNNDALELVPVSTLVNNPRNDTEDILL
ncbi:MAG TPA: SOS response-associated peptidase [Bacteroidia bacterium]|nr:SOS response-associated peptidase [Bacteroidia bacterium]